MTLTLPANPNLGAYFMEIILRPEAPAKQGVFAIEILGFRVGADGGAWTGHP